MTPPSEFVEHVVDQLRAFGAVRARRMFGGTGLYRGDVMFGLIADGVFYLKADERNRPAFEEAGTEPFRYRRRGRADAVVMSYWEVPGDVLEDAEVLAAWAREAHAAALRGAKPKRKAAAGAKPKRKTGRPSKARRSSRPRRRP